MLVPGRDGTSARATCWSQHTACTGGQPARSRTFVAWILLSCIFLCVDIPISTQLRAVQMASSKDAPVSRQEELLRS